MKLCCFYRLIRNLGGNADEQALQFYQLEMDPPRHENGQ